MYIFDCCVIQENISEPDSVFDIYLQNSANNSTVGDAVNKAKSNSCVTLPEGENVSEAKDLTVPPVIITPEDSPAISINNKLDITVALVIKSLIDFLSNHSNPLWNYEDITAKVWTVKSAEQIDVLLQHILKIFQFSLPNAHINERWAQTALQLGLSCSSRHYAGRSLQIYRALRVPISSRMLSDILSRLVETVAEQGEDMQGKNCGEVEIVSQNLIGRRLRDGTAFDFGSCRGIIGIGFSASRFYERLF